MFKKYVICIVLSVLALIPVGAAAQNTTLKDQNVTLPDPGITPDSWVYGFKRAFENIDMALTFGEEAKVKKYLHYAELRLSEATAMVENGKIEHVDDLAQDYQSQLENANRLSLSSANDNRANVTEMVANATARHIEVLERVRQQVPEQAKDSIDAAKNKSMRGNQEAVRALAKDDPHKAAKITMEVAKGRVANARQAAQAGKTEDVTKAAQEYEEYAKLGEEIANISKQMGKNQVKVNNLVKNATLIHQIVLKNVLQKVPPQAQSAIKDAINKSRTGQETSAQALNKTSGITGEASYHDQTSLRANTTGEISEERANTTQALSAQKPEQGQEEFSNRTKGVEETNTKGIGNIQK